MKKLALIGFGIGILNLAQATSTSYNFSTTSLTTLEGNDYYSWDITSGLTSLENALSTTGGQTITSATLTYYGFEFTAAGSNLNGGGQLWTQLLGAKTTLPNSVASGVTYGVDNDAITDAFGTSGVLINKDSWTGTFTTPTTLTEYIDPVAGATALLTSDVLGGFIDIGIDPDCKFVDTSICLTINTATKNVPSVPDQAMTASLLGMSFLGLLAFRRKLVFN